MSVRMRAVDDARKGAIGHRAGVVLELTQPLESQVANAVEIVVGEVGGGDHLVDQRQAGVQKAIERRHADDHRVDAHIEVELAANARHPIGDVERRLPAAALVEEARGDRHQPTCIRGIHRRSTGHQQHHGGHWHRSMRHRAQLETVGQHPLGDARKAERTIGARDRETAAVDAAHETWTPAAAGNASSRRPRGTTLNDTDGAVTSHFATAEATPLLVTFTYRCRSRSK